MSAEVATSAAATAAAAATANLPQVLEHSSKSVNYTPFAVRWVPASARFVALGSNPRGTGALQVYQLEQGAVTLACETEKKHAFKCGTFGASAFEQRHLATGDHNGGLAVWDLDRMQTPVFSAPAAHAGIINCIEGVGGLNVGVGAPELVTGGRDGCVRIWDTRQQEPVVALEPAEGQKARDCWAVAFGNAFSAEERCVVAGYDNGDLKLLDLRTNRLRWETNVGNGVTSLQFDRRDIAMNKLAATTLEGRFHVFDMRTQHPEDGFAGVQQRAHASTVWQAAHLPQNRDVWATTGGNGTLDMWKYEYPAARTARDEQSGVERGVVGKLTKLTSKKITDQPIVSLDWSADRLGLCAMACLDQTVRVALVTKLGGL